MMMILSVVAPNNPKMGEQLGAVDWIRQTVSVAGELALYSQYNAPPGLPTSVANTDSDSEQYGQPNDRASVAAG
jgi:hypothetical protein